ncbi:uncharacterized protein B0H18DRAFT_950745 [Fomitopsis serialis]|uniref:uncharacterized protein n=1 Tax=Fomitopsis serialis TaxID=139415 RepID=UPI002007BB18|nr:uncharacterized protein B0H18DRAFT_950745 [Neoantrodia serialis]KAH9936478.1 hypothetical protein B0H18DRAFT_950745 [Neoantrodia serialis]
MSYIDASDALVELRGRLRNIIAVASRLSYRVECTLPPAGFLVVGGDIVFPGESMLHDNARQRHATIERIRSDGRQMRREHAMETAAVLLAELERGASKVAAVQGECRAAYRVLERTTSPRKAVPLGLKLANLELKVIDLEREQYAVQDEFRDWRWYIGALAAPKAALEELISPLFDAPQLQDIRARVRTELEVLHRQFREREETVMQAAALSTAMGRRLAQRDPDMTAGDVRGALQKLEAMGCALIAQEAGQEDAIVALRVRGERYQQDV